MMMRNPKQHNYLFTLINTLLLLGALALLASFLYLGQQLFAQLALTQQNVNTSERPLTQVQRDVFQLLILVRFSENNVDRATLGTRRDFVDRRLAEVRAGLALNTFQLNPADLEVLQASFTRWETELVPAFNSWLDDPTRTKQQNIATSLKKCSTIWQRKL
jgi:uncharacterized metal-binding protein